MKTIKKQEVFALANTLYRDTYTTVPKIKREDTTITNSLKSRNYINRIK
jgi:hypothetical protein